jgi:uncharacterized protein YcbX
MAGVPIDSANLGWHGLQGDRRFAFRRTATRSGFPWLSASRLNELILHHPFGASEHDPSLPTHVRTPDGRELELFSIELRAALSASHGEDLELMRLDHGIFDEAPLSVISAVTIREIERQAGRHLDLRRFRPNVIFETTGAEPFHEDTWVGKTLMFGDQPDAPAVTVTLRDKRCVMLNIDPDTAENDANIMKTTVRLNGNYAGVYGTVVREGRAAVGQTLWLKD